MKLVINDHNIGWEVSTEIIESQVWKQN